MSVWNRFTQTFKNVLDISEHIDTSSAEKAIRNNVFFRGPNAWILAIATVIASVGLNVNSIPVIIGAMLISPLMGPIFGLGLGLGINDVDLMKTAGKNLLVMIGISLVASFLYFLITPLSLNNPTELLARTNPTIYDVLIALFGGFAGIFEQCRKDKGTVFAGVAIATALMPPLCTAGYGLASGNLHYFAGALYLFIINCLFIMLATYTMVKYLKFNAKEIADEKLRLRTKAVSTILIILFIIPSIWSAVLLVKQTNFEDRALAFIEDNKTVDKSFIYDHKITHSDGSKVELFFTGEPLSQSAKSNIEASAKEHGIKPEQIIISEHVTAEGTDQMELVRSIYERTDSELSRRDAQIQQLNEQLKMIQGNEIPYMQLQKEIALSYPQIGDIYFGRGALAARDSLNASPCIIVIPKCSDSLRVEEKIKLTEWLKLRLATENVVILPILN